MRRRPAARDSGRASAATPLPAACRLGDYKVHSVLGRGGFSITYKAGDMQARRWVVLKEYLPVDVAARGEHLRVVPLSESVGASFAWGMDRFLLEAQILARFRHPNLVSVERYFRGNGTAYIAMSFEEGMSLLNHCKAARRTLTEAEVLGVLVPVLEGLAGIHGANFLHRDIKPGNLILRPDGSPVLIDFGSARHMTGSSRKTVVVTHGYSPFEQYHEEGAQGPWTDIYALAATAYHVLTGRMPPSAAERVAQSRKARDPLVPLAQAYKGTASPHFLQAIDWGLELAEAARPQTVDQWRTALVGGSPLGRAARALKQAVAQVAASARPT